MPDVNMAMSAEDPLATQFPLRQRFKISELPLVKEQRTSIDSLLLRFKKQGGYDSIRKQIWANYNKSDAKAALSDAIFGVCDAEIEKDANLLSRERGKAATLMQGALERSGIFQDVESRLDLDIAGYVEPMLAMVRDIRRAEVGDEKAQEEETRGSKTDDQYRAETESKATERMKNRARMEELARQTAELKAKIAAEEERRRKRELAKKEEEEKKRKEAEEEQRRLEKVKLAEEEERKEAERIKARDERARQREEARKERELEYEREREERHRRRSERDKEERRVSTADVRKEHLEEKDLEATALELLLSEGKQLARRSGRRPEYDVNDQSRRPSHRRERSRESMKREVRRSRSRDRRQSVRETTIHRDESKDREEGEARSQHSSGSPVRIKVDRDRRPRSASPIGIDRYVPGGGTHRTDAEKERARDKRKPSHRDDERERERKPDHTSDRPRDAKYDRYEGRDRDRDEQYRDRDRRDRERERERSRDRYREHDRTQERDRERRSRSPRRRDDRDRDRDRRDDRRVERRDDRRDRDHDRDRDRERERDRNVDRDRERDRERDHRDRRDKERRDDRNIDRYLPGR